MTTTSERVGEIFRDITGTKRTDPDGRKNQKLPDSNDSDVQAAAIPQPVSQSRAETKSTAVKESEPEPKKAPAKKAPAKKSTAKKTTAKKK